MDSLCLKAGIPAGLPSPFSVAGALEGRAHPAHICALGRSTNCNGISLENSVATAAPPQRPSSSSRFSFTYPFSSLGPRPGIGKPNGGVALDDAVVVVGSGEDGQVTAVDGSHNDNDNDNGNENEPIRSGDNRGSWVLKILHVRSLWSEQGNSGVNELEGREVENTEDDTGSGRSGGCSCCHDGDSGVCSVDEEEEEEEQAEQEEIKFDRDSFSRLLRRVSLAEAKLYGQMSYLGNLAYTIPQIKEIS